MPPPDVYVPPDSVALLDKRIAVVGAGAAQAVKAATVKIKPMGKDFITTPPNPAGPLSALAHQS
jgi:uroporphyrinogen-III synthase